MRARAVTFRKIFYICHIMKRILITLVSFISLSFCYVASAQNNTQVAGDVYLVPNPKTARWSYIETDGNGKQISTVFQSIESMEGDGINGCIKIRVEEVAVASPTDTVKNSMYYSFKDGEYMVNMQAMFEKDILGDFVDMALEEKKSEISEEDRKKAIEEVKKHVNISGETRGIPRYPQVGKLPDYTFSFKISIMNMKVLGQQRMIVGTEKVQTEAGTFDCFILEETITTKAMMMKEVEKTKSWYAYGIGLVKEATYDKAGKLLSTMTLNKINW